MGNNIYYKRLESLWKSMGFKDAKEFAKSIGWKRSENILRLGRSEKTKPGIDILRDIAKYHSDFDFYFLLTGNKKEYKTLDSLQVNSNDPAVPYSNCPDCISKQKEIDALKEALDAKEELLEMYRDKKTKCG